MVDIAINSSLETPAASASSDRGGRYSRKDLPVVDYSRHPAYGAVLPRPTLAQRVAALKKFAKGFAIISSRLVSDYEHLPKLTGHQAKLKRFVTTMPTYGRLIATQRWNKLRAGDKFAPQSSQGRQALATLERDGIIGLRLTAEQHAEMCAMLAPYFDQLEKRLAETPPEQQKFDESRLWLDPDTHKAIFGWFTEAFRTHGLLEACSAYLGRPVGVAHVNPQINRPTDNFWGNRFKDVGVEDSVCDYCHVDATYNVLKLIVYVSHVGPQNGPFSYVRGSHRAGDRLWDGLVRRANDYAGLSSTRPPARALFNALPRTLQRKAAFGADIVNDSDYVKPVLEGEWTITSGPDNGVLFDPCGIHRGGMVREGERRVVTLMMAELPT